MIDPAAVAPTRPARLGTDEGGFVVAWMGLLLLVLLAFAGFAVDVANWWWTAQKAQKAADSAALAGVVYLPDDETGAFSTARTIATGNGYEDGVNATVLPSRTSRPTQLRVEVETTISNFFAGLVGYQQQTITRSATAEFRGPVAMGSPANNMCNRPIGTGDVSWSPHPDITDPAALDPQCWANIAGERTNKANGDRFTANRCAGGEYSCSGTNAEYRADGYYYYVRVRVGAGDLGKRLAIQAYDPAFVQTGDTCNDFGDDEANYRTGLAALGDRYNAIDPTLNARFCPGDHFIIGGYRDQPPTMRFTPRKPDDSPWQDDNNEVMTHSTCQTTNWAPFVPPNDNPSSSHADSLLSVMTNSAHPQHAYTRRVFHQWVNVCDAPLSAFGITSPGTYEIVLQTSMPPGDVAGHNRYSIRAGLRDSPLSDVNPGGQGADGTNVSIFANGRLPMYANTSNPTNFYIARLMPGSGNTVLSLELWDIGDGGGTGTMRVLPPAGATYTSGGSQVALTNFSGCTGTTDNGTPVTVTSTCTITGVNTTYNGRVMNIKVPVPEGYDCNADDVNGCWVRIRVDLPAATDTTTWSANIEGDPVRLVVGLAG